MGRRGGQEVAKFCLGVQRAVVNFWVGDSREGGKNNQN